MELALRLLFWVSIRRCGMIGQMLLSNLLILVFDLVVCRDVRKVDVNFDDLISIIYWKQYWWVLSA